MWFWAAGPTEDANEFRKLSPFPCLTCNSSSPAPNQHHSSGSCPGELGNSGPHPLSLVLSHIHSKTACRGASACQWHASYEPTGAERRPSPSAPANSLVPRPCENRMAWGFFVPMRPWTRSINSQLMLHPVLSSHIRPQPVFTAVFPSSTQNAPGFALFGLFRVRLALFRCFGAAKFLPAFLCILPYSGHRLKPSVMPCRREVSFFT